jgi:hypothetical protein
MCQLRNKTDDPPWCDIPLTWRLSAAAQNCSSATGRDLFFVGRQLTGPTARDPKLAGAKPDPGLPKLVAPAHPWHAPSTGLGSA